MLKKLKIRISDLGYSASKELLGLWQVHNKILRKGHKDDKTLNHERGLLSWWIGRLQDYSLLEN